MSIKIEGLDNLQETLQKLGKTLTDKTAIAKSVANTPARGATLHIMELFAVSTSFNPRTRDGCDIYRLCINYGAEGCEMTGLVGLTLLYIHITRSHSNPNVIISMGISGNIKNRRKTEMPNAIPKPIAGSAAHTIAAWIKKTAQKSLYKGISIKQRITKCL